MSLFFGLYLTFTITTATYHFMEWLRPADLLSIYLAVEFFIEVRKVCLRFFLHTLLVLSNDYLLHSFCPLLLGQSWNKGRDRRYSHVRTWYASATYLGNNYTYLRNVAVDALSAAAAPLGSLPLSLVVGMDTVTRMHSTRSDASVRLRTLIPSCLDASVSV